MRNDEVILWGMKKAAAELDLTSEHLRRLVDRGALPSTRDSSGKRLLFASDVAAFRKKRDQTKNGGKPKLKLKIAKG